MNTVANLIRSTWESTLGRIALIVAAAGWVPAAALSMIHAQLTH